MDFYNIKIGTTKVLLPKPDTVKLKRYIEFLDWQQEQQDLDFLGKLDPDDSFWLQMTKQQQMQVLNRAALELSWWSETEYKFWRQGVNISDLIQTWFWYRDLLMFEEAEDAPNCFEIEGEIYYLPKKHMVDSTFEDFAESNSYEQRLMEVINGEFKALFDICAILLRKEGETYDSYNHEHRATFMMDHLTAFNAFEVAFFLQRLSDTYITDMEIYTKAETLAALKQVTKNS